MFSDRNANILEGKNEEQKRIPTWSSKKRSFIPISVERADALSTENIVSDAFWVRKMEQRQKTKLKQTPKVLENVGPERDKSEQHQQTAKNGK